MRRESLVAVENAENSARMISATCSPRSSTFSGTVTVDNRKRPTKLYVTLDVQMVKPNTRHCFLGF